MHTNKAYVVKCFPHLAEVPLSLHEEKVLLRLYLTDVRLKQPHNLVEVDFGGWVPNSIKEELLAGSSLTTQEVHARNQRRAAKDYAEADLIKRTLAGGSVELLDFLDGTIYYYSTIKLLDV